MRSLSVATKSTLSVSSSLLFRVEPCWNNVPVAVLGIRFGLDNVLRDGVDLRWIDDAFRGQRRIRLEVRKLLQILNHLRIRAAVGTGLGEVALQFQRREYRDFAMQSTTR